MSNKITLEQVIAWVQQLQDQNKIDFQAIKLINKTLDKLKNEIEKGNNLNNLVIKKMVYEYNQLKKIIVDENVALTLNQKIIDSENKNKKKIEEVDNKLKNEINKVSSQLEQNTNKLSGMITFNTFPNSEQLSKIPVNSTFEVKGFNINGDIEKCMYKKTGWSSNSLVINGNYIQPITRCNGSEIYLPFFGIKEGESYASQNSSILENIKNKNFGSTLVLPSGHFYFKNPIDLVSNQLSLKGQSMTFTSDPNTTSQTWLHFNELSNEQSAILFGSGFIRDVNIRGNIDSYSYTIDRTKTYVDSENIENEVYSVKTYGIKGGSISNIQNVYVYGFYYGCYLNTGNIYINNFFARNCHYGLSIGNDTKAMGVYGWNVHTLLQIRGSISSAIQIRCDSCHHLVEITGYNTGVYLADLDADYCLGCILKIGKHESWGVTKNLVVNGIRGRCSVLHTFDTTLGDSPTSDDILSDEELFEWGIISVCKYNSLIGANITLNSSLLDNPIDGVSNYRTPSILLVSGNGSVTKGINITSSIDCEFETDINRDYLLKYIKSFCENSGHNTNICINTSRGIYYYNKYNASNITTSKTSIETLT